MVFLLIATGGLGDEFNVQDGNLDGVLSGTEVEGLKLLDQDGHGEVSRTSDDQHFCVTQQKQLVISMYRQGVQAT